MTAAPGRLAFLLPDLRGGGAERVALTLIEAFVARGQPVDLLVMEAAGEFMPLLPPEVRVIDLKAPRIRQVLRPLIAYLRREPPAALQVSMWPLTVVGILAARIARTRTRVVVSDHIALSRQYPGRTVQRAIRWSVRLAYPRAAARVVVSRDAADDLAALSGIERASIEVIYNPIPPVAGVDDLADDARAAWPANTRRILTVGSLKQQKNHGMLLAAVAALPADCPASLLILGAGDLRESLTARAAALGIGDRVVMPGFVTDPSPFFRAAALFVLSSDYEGFGNVLVEAMRHGVPVVSTDCRSGPREILADGRFGRLVPVGDHRAMADAIAAALADRHDPAALRDRAEALSGGASIAAYLRLMLGSAVS